MNQFNFLKKYSKFEILQFISSLQAFSENSSHFLRLSVLQKNAMLKCKGNKHLNIYDVSKEIERHYAFDVKTDPQEFMFVELVHTPKGSYKVFTGSLSNQQYNLTRLLYIAKVTNINSRLLNIIYLLLDISDQLATKFGYARYEAGNKESEKIYYPNYKEYTQLTKSLLLTKSELSYLLEKYELNLNDIEGIVYKELENRKKIKECSQDNNLIDYFPLYKINSDYLILQPSSLLCCAFVKCITILANEMGKKNLKKNIFKIQ